MQNISNKLDVMLYRKVRDELYGPLYEELGRMLYGEVYGKVREELGRTLYWDLRGELYEDLKDITGTTP